MSDIFISYARSTAVQAQAIAEALRALGYGVWRDDELPAHRAYADVIEERLKAAKAVLVIWSAEAVKSHWVRAEADAAREAGTLVQLRLDDAIPPMPFNQIQCADLGGWSGDLDGPGWKKVAASIADLAGAASSPAEGAPRRSARKLSVCVLPFANISDDPQQEYFSDGISEDIITDLSKVSALSVTARNTAFTFKGKSHNIPQIARELAVTHVLEGSVRKAGRRVRITAQLIDGGAGDHLWAERWDRDLTDIFALQDEISQAIVAALRLKLLPEEKRAIGRRGTESAEAYDLLLMAREHRRVSAGDSRADEMAIRLLTRAVEIDPGYAFAWAQLARAQYALRFDRGRAGDDGLAAAEKAIALDPALGEAHVVKADVLRVQGRREEARAELDLALRLAPDSFQVNASAGQIAYYEGKMVEAERFFARASELEDETSVSGNFVLMSVRRELGDAPGMREAAERVLAKCKAELARQPGGVGALIHGACALAALGQGEQAREWMKRALLIDPDNAWMRYNFACLLAGYLDDPEDALAMLAPLFPKVPAGLLAAARTDPDLAAVRDDPRFVAMIAAAEARLTAETAPGGPSLRAGTESP